MKDFLQKISKSLNEFGYKRGKNSFWKIDDGFYKLIDFQRGLHGGDYFFINICLHPVGLPQLSTKGLSIIENPKEYECLIRQRIEEIVSDSNAKIFNRELVSVNNDLAIEGFLNSIMEIEEWFTRWGNYKAIVNAKFDELSDMFTVVPILKMKAYLLIRCFCTYKIGEIESAQQIFSEYLDEIINDLQFKDVDKYISGLMNQ